MNEHPSRGGVPDRLAAALADRYRLERELGQGGMATVYLAQDLKHDRQVAVKVLKPELAAVVGGERFVAEIRTTANLSHPNILPLFDSGEADGFLFYVMPYVQGETLAGLLLRERQLAITDAVRIAGEVAEALDYAHRNGVVHRDVKPANILLQDGRPLVSDFGIALAVSQAGGGRLTETGLSMGTPHYMSPEQASGDRDVDPRADIYSLGCVLFEMLTGEPPYGGGSAQAVLARILTTEPDRPTAVRSTIPPHVDGAIRRAMEKLPADRFESAADFAAALRDPAYRYGTDDDAVVAATARRWRTAALVAGALAVLLPVLALLAVRPGPADPPPTTRNVFGTRPGQEIVDLLAGAVSLSPDGSTLVYVGPAEAGTQLWVRYRDRVDAVPLPGTRNAQSPEVDPTGRWVAFLAGQELRKVPLAGGPVVTVADSATGDVGTLAWLEDGTIAYSGIPDFRPVLVSAEGGSIERLDLPMDGRMLSVSYSGLPGSGLLMTVCGSLCQGTTELWVWRRDRGFERILPGFVGGWYVNSGHIVAVRGSGDVFAVPFDAESMEVRGDPVPLFSGVEVDQNVIPDMDVSPTGRLLARISDSDGEIRELAWIDRTGRRTAVDPDFRFQSGTFPGVRISPDGRLAALGRTTDEGSDIWIKELDDGPEYRLTFSEALEYRPAWYPDGDSILFVSERNGGRDLFRRRANATGPVEAVLDVDPEISQGVLSPDGAWLVYRMGTAEGRDIWMQRRDGASDAVPLVAEPQYDEKAPAISPDGRWIAYESDETGQDEVYVRPFPAVAEGKWQISVNGGREPVWARSGREIFYRRGDEVLTAARIDPGPPFRVGDRTGLFSLEGLGLSTSEDHATFDVAPDDQRFLFPALVVETSDRDQYWLSIESWMTELERIGGPSRR